MVSAGLMDGPALPTDTTQMKTSATNQPTFMEKSSRPRAELRLCWELAKPPQKIGATADWATDKVLWASGAPKRAGSTEDSSFEGIQVPNHLVLSMVRTSILTWAKTGYDLFLGSESISHTYIHFALAAASES